MKIKMLVGLSGNEYSLAPGDEHDFSDAEAIRLIEAGYGVPAVAQHVERAVAEIAPERRNKRGKNVVSNESDHAGGD
ncbi:hypothetical protein [Ensifer sp.]|jgi:hypothetical protein|uniref:hypothetical protein n=1 Tax=Ensifer sp. TaxID=1872086 RepID=UPI002E1622E8|nr:hypothetical protein [Ensifer sp.]